MLRKRTMIVVSGSRAEYGLLEPVMHAIDAHQKLNLRVVVAGLHMVQHTDRDIIFPVAAKVAMQKRDDTGFNADVEAVGRGVTGFGRVFTRLKPDFVVVLGDRIEVFAAASAASLGGYRVAHIHGGDRAEGVADESIRHAVSKLSHLHFPATPTSRRRLVRMGEKPAYVRNVGSPAIDGLSSIDRLKDGPKIIAMQHPIGESNAQEQRWAKQTLEAVRSLKMPFFIGNCNHDAGSEGVRRALKLEKGEGYLARPAFLSMLGGARVIVGNSSAGLIEAAAMRIACVNIGPRQDGREKPKNVIDCNYGEDNVRRAIRRAMKLDLRQLRHPYGRGNTGRHIADLLSTADPPWRKQNTY